MPSSSLDTPDINEYRVHAINNILLGKDERIFLAKDTASNVVNPLDPNFTRIRDTVMLDIIVDLPPLESDVEAQPTDNDQETVVLNTTQTSTTSSPDIVFQGSFPDNSEVAANMKQAFNSLLQQVAGFIAVPTSAPSPVPQNSKSPPRHYIPAVTPVGPGIAPLPDVEDALGPDIHGNPQGTLLWHSIYIADTNCDNDYFKPQLSIPAKHSIIVMKRGRCSFDEKLRNIPTFAPSAKSLKLVIIVNFDLEEEEVHGGLIRPLLEQQQSTMSGLPRHNPIPMVMVGGGEETWKIFKQAVGLGIKRRYEMQAQGIKISNLVVL